MPRILPFCLFLAALPAPASAASGLRVQDPVPPAPEPSTPAETSPDPADQGTKPGITDFVFEAKSLGGTQLNQDRYRESVLIVDLWGTWCGPCKEAVPVLVKLYNKYKHQGLEIVGLNYNEGEGNEAAEKVRAFAAKNGITYDLAIGNQAVVDQVDGFGGFPTMLFFDRGLKHSKTKLGFEEGDDAEIESWIRVALGLDEAGEVTAEEGERREAEAELEVAKKEKVAEGAIFQPGAHDTGFSFAFPTLDGSELEFDSLRGQAVLLAVTSTWDEEAQATAAVLESVRSAAEGALVLGAYYERKGNSEARTTLIREFCAAQQVSYTPVHGGLKLIRKIHKMNALPTFLVFDKTGILVHRAEGLTERTAEALKTALMAAQEG